VGAVAGCEPGAETLPASSCCTRVLLRAAQATGRVPPAPCTDIVGMCAAGMDFTTPPPCYASVTVAMWAMTASLAVTVLLPAPAMVNAMPKVSVSAAQASWAAIVPASAIVTQTAAGTVSAPHAACACVTHASLDPTAPLSVADLAHAWPTSACVTTAT